MFPINTDHRDYLAFRLATQLPSILPFGLSDIISLQPALHFSSTSLSTAEDSILHLGRTAGLCRYITRSQKIFPKRGSTMLYTFSVPQGDLAQI